MGYSFGKVPEFSNSSEAQRKNIENKYFADKTQKEKFDSITPQQAQNIADLANVYSFAAPGLVTELGKMGLTKEQAEPYIIAYQNAYANDGVTIEKELSSNADSAMGVFPWSNVERWSPVDAAKLTLAQAKKFTQVASTVATTRWYGINRILRTYMIARERAINKTLEAGDTSIVGVDDKGEYLKLNAFRNPIFMKEFFKQIKPKSYIGNNKNDTTKDLVPFMDGGQAWEDAGATALGVGFEQYGAKLFDLNVPGEESGLGSSWFPFFGSGSEAWDESQRRGKLYANFRGSGFSATTPNQPVSLGGLVVGQFFDANTLAYKNLSGVVDGIGFLRGDALNKLQALNASTKSRFRNFGLLRIKDSNGRITYQTVDRKKGIDVFLKSENAKELAQAWSTKLDDLNLLFKTFTPDIALRMHKASKLKGDKVADELIKTWDDLIFKAPQGMPQMPPKYQWNKIADNIGLNKIFNNLSKKEKDIARSQFGDWTPKGKIVWANQADSIEQVRRVIINGRLKKSVGDNLLLEFAEATMRNKEIGYGGQVRAFKKVIDAVGDSMKEAGERPDVVEDIITKLNSRLRSSFSESKELSYWIDQTLSWENAKSKGTVADAAVEGIHTFTRNLKETLIGGELQPTPTPHLNVQEMMQGIELTDLRKVRQSTGKISKYVRIAELNILGPAAKAYSKKFGYLKDNLIEEGWLESHRGVDLPRQFTKAFINSLWFAQKSIWTPLQLVTRLAFPVRITADGQAKLASDGYPSLGNNPGEWFGLLLGKNNKTLKGELAKNSEEMLKLTRDQTRSLLGESNLKNLRDDWIVYDLQTAFTDPKRKKMYIRARLEEISLLKGEQEYLPVAKAILDGESPQVFAKRMFGGDLDDIRQMMNREMLDEYGNPQNALNSYEATLGYIETQFQRINDFTNNKEILKYLASEDNVFRYKNPKGHMSEFKIYNIGDDTGFLAPLKDNNILKKDGEKQLTSYLTREFNDKAPAIIKEIEAVGGNPVGMGMNIWQQGPRHIRERILQPKQFKDEFVAAWDSVWETLFNFPAAFERVANRSPLYRTVLWTTQADAYQFLPKNLQKDFIKKVDDLPKMYDDVLKDDSLVKAGLDKFFDTDSLNKSTKQLIEEAIEEAKKGKVDTSAGMFKSLDELEEYAHATAKFVHDNLLYNLTERGYFADFTRIMFPFMGAYIEQIGTWSQVLARNPYAIRTGNLIVNGAKESGIVYETPQGEMYFAYPWIGTAIENKYFNDQNDRIKIGTEAPLDAINLISSGFGPGASPWLQIPAGMFIPDAAKYDTLAKFFNPFGARATSWEEFKSLEGKTKYLFPAYWSKLATALGEGTGFASDEKLWNTHIVDTAKALAATGQYTDEFGKIDQDALLKAAAEVGKRTLLIRAAGQFGLITGFSYDYRLKIDEDKLRQDFEENFGKDVELGLDSEEYLRFTAVMSIYNKVLRTVNDDDAAAIYLMTQMLGADWLDTKEGFGALNYLTKGRSYNKVGIRSLTEEGYNWERENSAIEEYLPGIFGLFAPPPEPDADFSYTAWFAQNRKGNRVYLTPEEWAKSVNQMAGSRMWRIATVIGGEGLTVQQKAKIKTQIDTLFPDWYVKSIQLGLGEENWKELEKAVGIEVAGQEAIPEDIVKLLKNTDLYEPLQTYMQYRESALNRIGQLKGIERKYGLSNSQIYYLKNTQGTQNFRNALKQIGESLASENPAFAIFWEQIGKRELEQEYYEDKDGNLVALLEESG